MKETLAFSAAAVLSGRGALGTPAAVAAAPVARPEPPRVEGAPEYHLLAVGDWGVKKKDLARQQAVSDAMRRYLERRDLRPDGLMLVGDNFYGGLGGKGLWSPRWKDNVEAMYPDDVFACPLYAALGNHDYNDEKEKASVTAQLAYGRREVAPNRWTLPHKWYRFDLPNAEARPVASVWVLDTNFCYPERDWVTPAERRQQLRWLARELSEARDGRWRIVAGHHPVYSNGQHGDTQVLVDLLDPLLRKHKVDLYLAGHDHDLQHLEFKRHPTAFVVSGGGGARARDLGSRRRVPFGKAVYGFTHLELSRARLTVRHVDPNGRELHAFSKRRPRA